MHRVILKPGREKSLLRRHPWIFSGAIARVEGDPPPGATVEIADHGGRRLAKGAYSPASQIRVRVWSFNVDVGINAAFFHERIAAACARRAAWLKEKDGACRLINAESDELPGVVVDRYAGYLVCQFLTAGAEYWRNTICAALQECCPSRGIWERSDVDVRRKEGLKPRTGLLAGAEPPTRIEIDEAGVRFAVDVRGGHKTGFYLDQRDNRMSVAGFCDDAEVLNCFAYSGGFCLWALRGGARRITNIESSAEALALLEENARLNHADAGRIENLQGDVFDELRGLAAARRRFDVVILDPPRFVESRAHLEAACRGYKDINRLGLELLKPGGRLFTFSCSGLLKPDLFQKIVADAALDAGRPAHIIRRFGQAPDHPVLLSFPEGGYLKGLLVQAMD